MARLIPTVRTLEQVRNRGERDVARALLEQLDDNVVVYHSYPWLQIRTNPNTRADHLKDGEIDFVIVDPKRGVLVLEVKASEIVYDPVEHRWSQLNRREGKWHHMQGPFDQAEKNKSAILNHLRDDDVFEGAPPFTIGHAVVFTETRWEGPLPANAHPAILLGPGALRDMRRAVQRALAHWCALPRLKAIHTDMFSSLRSALSPMFRLVPVLWRTIADQEEKLLRLTEAQHRILGFIRRHPRSAIEGVAGSGKTLLAMTQARRHADAGLRVLLLCYNKHLAQSLCGSLSPAYEDQVVVSTFHSICAHFCRLTMRPFNAQGDAFWRDEAADLLEAAALDVDPQERFDAIVVDEGQDFLELWWAALEALYRGDEPRRLTVFYDPRQRIYRDAAMTAAELQLAPFTLDTNCRNTQAIAAYSARALSFEAEVDPGAPKGMIVEEERVHSEADVIKRTRKTVQDWCLRDRGGLKPSQVAILVPWLRHDRWPERFGVVRLVHDLEAWRRGEGVLLETHRRFKGLEADAIVLAGVPDAGTQQGYSAEDHYVASSRAKHVLKVIRT